MTIDMSTIYFVLSVLACILLAALVMTILKVNTLLSDVRDLFVKNTDNLDQVLSDLPKIVSNVSDITEVATDITADIVVTKENLKSNVNVLTDVVAIVKNVVGAK